MAVMTANYPHSCTTPLGTNEDIGGGSPAA